MSSVLNSRYLEMSTRLALGIEVLDAARELPLLSPVSVTFDDAPQGGMRQRLQRHTSNRHALFYDNYLSSAPRNADLRIFDQQPEVDRDSLYNSELNLRRYLPRRLRIALPSLAQAEALSIEDQQLRAICRPSLFPGAAYPMHYAATGVRAHAMRAATVTLPLRPARWVRVLATVPATEPILAASTVIGRAAGDERGEFLLLLRYHTAAVGVDPELSVRIRIFAPPEIAPPSPDIPARDPLWDLPLELPASLAENDEVLRGEEMPAGYTEVTQRIVDLRLGRLRRGVANFVI